MNVKKATKTPAYSKTSREQAADKLNLLGVDVDNLTMAEAIDGILKASESVTPTSFAFVNADCLNHAHTNPAYARILSRQRFVLADGIGVKMAAKLHKQAIKENVNGTDMFPLLCEEAARRGKTLFLLGGQPGVAEAAAANMQEQIPGLVFAGTHHGYFSTDEDCDVVQRINESGADILLVGLGAPRQEIWMHRNLASLDPKVEIGVGGLFDYYSGRIERAPLAFRKHGLEWVWRLLQEPKRLAKRYLIGNVLFVLRCLSDRLEAARMDSLPSVGQADIKRSRRSISRWRKRFQMHAGGKRALDIMFSCTALAVLSPVFLLTAAAIKLESPGPVFFKQRRVGLNGSRFDILKFRSMYLDAEERRAKLMAESDRLGSHFKMKSDPRVTKVGNFIRRFSIDELPQLWNVLFGSMSLVGPRPNLESEVEAYQLDELTRLNAKPGITCTWQVSGRAELPWDKQVQLDLDYVYEPSLLSDFKLLLQTIPAVLTGRGAY